MPQNVHASFWENVWMSSWPSGVVTAIAAMPSASSSACSIESAARRRMSGFATSRSTTTSIVCLYVFGNRIGSARSRTSPSIRARGYPLRASSCRSFSYSPLRPRTTGASTWNRVPSGSSITWSTICSGVWRPIGRPQL